MTNDKVNTAIKRLLPHSVLYNRINEFRVIKTIFYYHHLNLKKPLDFDSLASILPNYIRPRRNHKKGDVHWLLALFKYHFEDLTDSNVSHEQIREWIGFAIYLSVLSHVYSNPVQAKSILKKLRIYGYTQTADYQWFWDDERLQNTLPLSRLEFDPQYLDQVKNELNEYSEVLARAPLNQSNPINYSKRARQIEHINQVIEWAYYPERKSRRRNKKDKEEGETKAGKESSPNKGGKVKSKPWQNAKAESLPIHSYPQSYGFFNVRHVSDPIENNPIQLLPFCEGPSLHTEAISVEELVDAYNTDYFIGYSQPELSKKIEPLHNYDESVQQTYMAAHDFELSTNIRYLSKNSCQVVFNYLITYKAKTPAALLLFSLITSLPIKTLLVPDFFTKSPLLEYSNDQVFIMHKLGVSDRKETKTSNFENKSDLIYLPLPTDIVHKLATDTMNVTIEGIKEFIRVMKNELDIVYLTDTRISKALHMYIRRFISSGNSHYADLICRVPASIAPAIYYSSHLNEEIVSVYKEALISLSAGSTYDFSYFDYPIPSFSTGSMQVLNIEHVKNLILELSDWVTNSKTSFEVFNRYSVYIWYSICLSTGIRANNGIPGSVNQIDEEMGWLVVDDKPNRNSKSDRLIPLCTSAMQQITDYKRFLRLFRVNFIENRQLSKVISDALDNVNDVAVINLLETTNHLSPIKRGDIARVTPHDLDIDPYWVRHFVRTQLEKLGTPIPLINEVIGHEKRDQEALNKFSSITKQQIHKVGLNLEHIAQAIGIRSLTFIVEERLNELRVL